nr:PhzF family phenazine biosynthesis protein [uncultured Undibacterium sp.]
MQTENFYHVDVFAHTPLSGNGLCVFLNTEHWSDERMQKLTQEMRQFESIFLSEISSAGARARIFTVEEELPFAGHPVLGAAAILHRTQAAASDYAQWSLQLSHKTIRVESWKHKDYFVCQMNQGRPRIDAPLSAERLLPVLKRMNLNTDDLRQDLPAQVISTGLDYLILPVGSIALKKTMVCGLDLELELMKLGAKFVFVLDVELKEIRTWDNLGKVEDIATGSAAGPAAAYFYTHGLSGVNDVVQFHQGRFLGRPSRLDTLINPLGEVLVSGQVWPVSKGTLEMQIA